MSELVSQVLQEIIERVLPAWAGNALLVGFGLLLLALAFGYPRHIAGRNKEVRDFFRTAGDIPGRLMLFSVGACGVTMPLGLIDTRFGPPVAGLLAALFFPCAIWLIIRVLARALRTDD